MRGQPCSVTVLALEDNVRVVGVLRVIDRQDHDGPMVANDVTSIDVASGLFYFVCNDGEDLPFVGEFGGD